LYNLTERQWLLLKYWLPALLSGGIAWGLFVLAETPLVRASGLALVIVGMTLALRRMGALLAIAGSLALALAPAFWSQTGGGEGSPATIVIAIAAAVAAVPLSLALLRRPYLAPGIGVVVFSVLFWSQIGTPRSIRLTSFVMGWLVFLLMDMLLLTNPRPDDAAPPPILRLKSRDSGEGYDAQPYHTLGILLLLGIGILNDPLLTLLAPAVCLGLWLSRAPVPAWYLALLALIVGLGLRGLAVDYLATQGHLINLLAWRNAPRWIELGGFIIAQFGILSLLLSVVGLARLARWYPPLGIITMLAYGAYIFFGLVYSGTNRQTLLLPLLMIQIIWMTYAMFTLGEWLKKSFPARDWLARYAVPLAFLLLPVSLLLNLPAGAI
jgi:hypothetical protein